MYIRRKERWDQKLNVTESNQRCGTEGVRVGDEIMARIVKQRLGKSKLAGHHGMSMTHCLTSSLLDLCASQNVLPFNIQQPVKLFHLLSDCAFYMYCVFVLIGI